MMMSPINVGPLDSPSNLEALRNESNITTNSIISGTTNSSQRTSQQEVY